MKDETREALFDMAVVGLGMVALLLALACSGCYVGRAEFRGEDMQMYPIFGFGAEATQSKPKATQSQPKANKASDKRLDCDGDGGI